MTLKGRIASIIYFHVTGSEVSGDLCGNGNVHPFEELANILDFCLAILIITVDSVCAKHEVLGRAHQCTINTVTISLNLHIPHEIQMIIIYIL